MDIKFYENLLFRIRDRRSVLTERLISGTFETFDDYKLFVGKVKGLDEAELIIRLLFKDMYDINMEVNDKNGEYSS